MDPTLCPTPDGMIPCEFLPQYLYILVLQAINSLLF